MSKRDKPCSIPAHPQAQAERSPSAERQQPKSNEPSVLVEEMTENLFEENPNDALITATRYRRHVRGIVKQPSANPQ
jgi:hypothetical protein